METRTLQHIKTENISANPHNPRMIFDSEEMDSLKGSIKKVGILVPLTVYKNTKGGPEKEYIILDGERRWRCATQLGLKTIPANIIDEPEDITQNILFMFNIHHFKEEWALFPTALKLEVIMNKLDTESESIISDFTGVDRSTIRRCKRLLWYPKKYRSTLMEKRGKISTDFFIELYPIAHRLSYDENFNFNKGLITFVDSCISTFEKQESFTDVKQFRDVRKFLSYHEKNGTFSSFISKIEQFMESGKIEVFDPLELEENIEIKNIIKYSKYLNESLQKININELSDITLEDELKRLQKQLGKIIDEIN